MEEQVKVQTNKKYIKHYFLAYNRRNINEMLRLFSSDGIICFIPLGENGAGDVVELGSVMWSALFNSFPDIHAKLLSVKLDELQNFVCKVSIVGTQCNDFFGIKNNGLIFKSDHIFVFHFDERGKIDRVSINWDHQDFIRQLSQ